MTRHAATFLAVFFPNVHGVFATSTLLLIASAFTSTETSALLLPVTSLPRPTYYTPQNFDIQRYEVEVTVVPNASKYIEGRCDIIVTWLSDVQSPSVPINLRGPGIDSILLGKKQLSFFSVGEETSDTFHFDVMRGEPVIQGRLDTFSIYYHGTMTNEGGPSPWGGVQYQDSVLYALGVGFQNPWVSTTQHWMPCFDHPSDKATFRLSMTVPSVFTVASVGKMISNTLATDAVSRTLIWEENHTIATYLITFAVGKLVMLDVSTSPEGPPITIFTKPRDTASSRVSYRLVPRMLQTFDSIFVAYPFDKVGYVNTTIGAMEHQTLISFPVSIVQKRDTLNTTAAHELAHQWFGDWVTPLDFRHAWLTESFSTYCESLWIESLKGWPEYLKSVQNAARDYTNRISQNEGVFPLFDYPRAKPSSNYPETIYKKGAVVLAMVRALVGDEGMFNALRTYLQDNAEGNATTEDVKEALRPALGDYTNAFFDEWVYGRGWPQIVVNMAIVNNSWIARIEQVQNNTHPDWPIFTTLPVNVVFRKDSSSELLDTVIIVTNKSIEFPIASPVDFALNSGARCRSLLEVVSVTSVSDATEAVPTIAVYPNPADQTLEIHWSHVLDAAVLDVTSESGKTVYSVRLDHNRSAITIPTASWVSGSYYVRLIHNHSTTTVPIVLTH